MNALLDVSKKLNVVFAGTPEFAAQAMRAILEAGHRVVMVMTQPDRPAGRGLRLQPSPVKELAIQNQIAVIQPHSLKLDGKYQDEAKEAQKVLESIDFDVIVVAAYGLILPQWLLALTDQANRFGCINIHASLLPRWRGAAPIHRAIWSGDKQSGTCIMKMDEGLDTGSVICSEALDIQVDDTTGSLHDRLANQGGKLIVQVLNAYGRGQSFELQKQDEAGVTYAEKIKKEEALIDWKHSSEYIDRQIRALNPAPGTTTSLNGDLIKVWKAQAIRNQGQQNLSGQPGEVVELSDQSIVVQTGEGCIRLLELQKAGGKKVGAGQFIQQAHLTKGAIFGAR